MGRRNAVTSCVRRGCGAPRVAGAPAVQPAAGRRPAAAVPRASVRDRAPGVVTARALRLLSRPPRTALAVCARGPCTSRTSRMHASMHAHVCMHACARVSADGAACALLSSPRGHASLHIPAACRARSRAAPLLRCRPAAAASLTFSCSAASCWVRPPAAAPPAAASAPSARRSSTTASMRAARAPLCPTHRACAPLPHCPALTSLSHQDSDFSQRELPDAQLSVLGWFPFPRIEADRHFGERKAYPSNPRHTVQV